MLHCRRTFDLDVGVPLGRRLEARQAVGVWVEMRCGLLGVLDPSPRCYSVAEHVFVWEKSCKMFERPGLSRTLCTSLDSMTVERCAVRPR